MIIIAIGTAMIIGFWDTFSPKIENLQFMAIFTIITLVLMFKPVLIDTNFNYSLEDVCAYGVIFLKGPGEAMWIMFLSCFIFEASRLGAAWISHRGRISPAAILANFSNPFLRVIITGGAGLAYAAVQSVTAGGTSPPGIMAKIAPYLACIAVFYLLSSFFGTLLMASREDFSFSSLKKSWKGTWRMVSPHLLMLAPLGVLLAILYSRMPLGALLLIVPVYIMHISISTINEVLQQALNTIEFMSVTLDQRDSYTFGHSERVSAYSAAVAVRMGLSPDQTEEIRKAGLIHDLGKITIPDRVLRKAAALDDCEYSVMKAHTHTLALLFKSLNVIPRMIPLQTAMYHHERYDGAGYIYGLKGDEIPLGSRILAVSDTYDAMTSDRPYRKGLPEEEALKRLNEASGTQLDPAVVAAFVKTHSEGAIEKIKTELSEKRKQQEKPPVTPTSEEGGMV